jgi:hypothetical protein
MSKFCGCDSIHEIPRATALVVSINKAKIKKNQDQADSANFLPGCNFFIKFYDKVNKEIKG